MAEKSGYLRDEGKLSDIHRVLVCLSQPQDKVEKALKELSDILTECVSTDTDDDTTLRNLCFSQGIVRALLGILRSSSQVSMLILASKCIALLTHGYDEGRIRLGELGAVPVMVGLLHGHLERRGPSDYAWSKEWVPVYEQVLICLRKLTFHNMANQQELARIGGIKLVIALATDKGLTSNFGQFTPEAKKHVELLTLRKKFISRVFPVPDDEKRDVICAFPALCTDTGLALNYPAFYVDLITKDGIWVARSLVEEGLVWPAPEDNPDSLKWTCLVVQNVEDGNSLWCHFCYKKQSQALVDMNETLSSLVCHISNGLPKLYSHECKWKFWVCVAVTSICTYPYPF